MTDQELHKNLESQIAAGEIKMRPRLFFVLRTVISIVTAVIVFLLAIFFVSAIAFASHRNGWWLLSSFGLTGWFRFFLSLPWILITFVLILIIVIEIFGWYFTSAYRRPVLYTILGVLLVVAGASFLVDQLHVHEYMDSHGGRIMRPLYRELDSMHPRNAFFGMLVSTSTDEWQIVNYQGKPQVVIINDATMFPDALPIDLNDRIIIFGDADEDATITARGVRKMRAEVVPDNIRIQWRLPPPPLP